MELCPCGSGVEFQKCCELYHAGQAAPSPEALMRSRYSAFAKKNADYLEKTTDPQTRGEFDFKANAEWARTATFTGLEILSAKEEGTKGFVEFKARFVMDGKETVHHEKSRFRKQDGRWYYREGRIFSAD